MIATNAHVVAHLLKVAMYEALKFRARTKLRNSGSSTDPIEFSPMNLIAVMVLFCHQRSVCNYLTHKLFRIKGGSSMDVGQVEMLWHAVHIEDRCFPVAENNTLMLSMVLAWFIVLFVLFCRFVSQPVQHLIVGIVSKLLFFNI